MNLPKRSEIQKRYKAEVSESIPEYELNHELLKLGLRGKKQYPVGPFFADLAFLKAMLVIEYDGECHIGKEEYDEQRDIFFQKNGWNVLRVNKLDDLEKVAKYAYKLILMDDDEMKINYVAEKRVGGFVKLVPEMSPGELRRAVQ